MVSLSSLPTEVTMRVGFLSPKELASCTSLSKQFLTITKTSSILTHALELGKAGLNDSYHLNLDRFDTSSSELLRQREQAWSTFTWTKQWDVPVERVYKNSEICGPVFVRGYTRRGLGTDTIDIYDFHDVNTNGFVTTLFLDAPYYGYAIDAGQDLLVLMEEYTPESPYYKLQLRKLSTGLIYDHTEIEQSTLSLEISSAGSWESSRSNIQIFGYSLLLAVRFYKWSDVRIINWKTAQYIMLFSGAINSRPSLWTMISETEILWFDYGENGPLLKYYTVDGFGSKLCKLENGPSFETDKCDDASSSGVLDQVIFNLPFKNHPHSLYLPTWAIGSISSEASFTPKPFSPFVKPTTFVYPPKSQIIGIQFYNAEATMFEVPVKGINIEMFIHLDLLRKFKDEVSSISSLSKFLWFSGILGDRASHACSKILMMENGVEGVSVDIVFSIRIHLKHRMS